MDAIRSLLSKSEGKILFFGIFLVIFVFVSLGLGYFIDKERASLWAMMIITNIVVGRVPSLSLGYASNGNHFDVVLANYCAEMMMVLLLYPLFVMSLKNLMHITWLDKYFTKVMDYQEQHKEFFETYGKIGLFLFVFIPIWFTGPIVGSMIGYIIHISHFKTLVIIAIATLFAMILWGVFLQEIVDFLKLFDPMVVLAIVVVMVIGYLIIRKIKQ